MLIQTLFTNFSAFLMMFVGFCFIIFVHELGHFLAAKAVNIKVTQFALGFGTAICSWRKGIGFRAGSTEPEYQERLKANPNDNSLGETEYRFNWVPLGGYVKMVGQEDLNPDATSTDPRSYTSRPAWARAIVLSAGVVMNVIFGLIFFVMAFMSGVALPPAIVGQVQPESPAAKTYPIGHEKDDSLRGLRPGDKIEAIDGEPVTDFSELAVHTALTARGEPVNLTIRRDGVAEPLRFAIVPEFNTASSLLSIGVGSAISTRVNDSGPLPLALAKAGVEPGMSIAQVDGVDVTRFDQMETAAAAVKGRPVQVTFASDSGKKATAEVAAVPQLDYTADNVENLAGLVPATVVSAVLPNSPADKAGVKAGDLIVRIDSRHWPRVDTVPGLIHKAIGRPIDLVLLRDNRPQSVVVTPSPEGKIGIVLDTAYHSNIIAEALHNSPLAPISFNDGSRIISINGEKVGSFADIQRSMAAAIEAKGFKPLPAAATQDSAAADEPAVTIDLEVQLNVAGYPINRASFTLTARQATEALATRWVLSPRTMLAFDMLRTPLAANNPIEATKLGILKTHQFMLQTYVTIARLFQGSVPFKHVRGPLGIADEGTRIAKQGTTYLLFFLGLISVNLAVMNFLPLPILDGGQLVLLLIEKIKGSPVSIRAQEVATYIALAALGCLVLATFVFDLRRLLNL